MNGHGDGDGAETGTGTGVQVNEGAQDGDGSRDGDGGGAEAGPGTGVQVNEEAQDGDGSGDGAGAGTGTGTEARIVAEMGTGTRITGTETRIGSGRAEKRRRSARNRKIGVDAMWETGETWVERGNMYKGKVGPVAANPDNLESNKEEGGGAQGTQGSSKNCTSRESISPWSRLIRGFRNKYNRSPLGRINASGIE